MRLTLLTVSLTLGILQLACNEPARVDEASKVDGAVESHKPFAVDGPCLQASENIGNLACIHTIPNRDTWDLIAMESMAVDQLKHTKYLFPAKPVEGIEPLFLNVNTVPLHYDLLVQGFPGLFPGLARENYIQLVTDGLTRTYFAGDLTEYIDVESTFFGFTVWDDPRQSDVVVTYEQVLHVYNEFREGMALPPLVFVPYSTAQRDAANAWRANFPIRGVNSTVKYEAYTHGVGYGTLRLYDMDEFNEATESAAFGFQDILILEEAPFDIERVVSGAVTGTRQGELSHLNVRSAARGTPNCYVADPLEEFAEWEGKLVKLECGEGGWRIEVASISEAQAWWENLRPDPVEVLAPDLVTKEFIGLLDIDTSTAEARTQATAQYGSKGANLAVLYQRIPTDYQLKGFLIPFAWYRSFIENNGWTVDLGQGEGFYTFAETITAWLQDESFLTDGLLRRQSLERLRDAMRAAPHDPEIIAQLADVIRSTFGSDDVMVRFRSSSNAEDALSFSGAGLYDSTSACLADELDDDDEGPSHCDPQKSNERSLRRALGKVWASLWKMEAFEERAWYGIDHHHVAMGILVNTRSADEQANIVAFSGNPTSLDDRYLINAQLGELDVVSSAAGIFPEKSLLEISNGIVSEITRVSHSSQEPFGWVLSENQLREVGNLFVQIKGVYPVDEEVLGENRILLDTEWKVLQDDRLIIKQIRPFVY